jgi:hypothetical protein
MKKSPGNNILISNYESICQEILSAFKFKQNLTICYWLDNIIGQFVVCDEKYFIAFEDVLFDIKHKCKPNTIFKYIDHATESNIFISYEKFVKKYSNKRKPQIEKPYQVSIP